MRFRSSVNQTGALELRPPAGARMRWVSWRARWTSWTHDDPARVVRFGRYRRGAAAPVGSLRAPRGLTWCHLRVKLKGADKLRSSPTASCPAAVAPASSTRSGTMESQLRWRQCGAAACAAKLGARRSAHVLTSASRQESAPSLTQGVADLTSETHSIILLLESPYSMYAYCIIVLTNAVDTRQPQPPATSHQFNPNPSIHSSTQ